MTDYIAISMLNDFVFCPYSIYLHNVYMETDETVFHAAPQTRGKIAHESVDAKRASNYKSDILALPVYSDKWGLIGKIDIYRKNKKLLIERKFQLSKIYQGQIYQIWAQMLCLQDMGYEVKHLAFYEISTNKTLPIALPSENDLIEFRNFINNFRSFNPATSKFAVNVNKCYHCIYCNLCDKTLYDNVYT